MKLQRAGLGLVALALLCSCSDDNDSTPPPAEPSVELRSVADAKRELGNVRWLLSWPYRLSQDYRRYAYWFLEPSWEPSEDDCDYGSYAFETGETTRSFEFFESTVPVYFQRRVHEQCIEYFTPTVEDQGAIELGESDADSGSQLRYALLGSGETPFVEYIYGDIADSTTEILGLIETQVSDSIRIDRSRSQNSVSIRYKGDFTDDARDRFVTYELELGTDSAPFSASIDASQRSWDGSYRYSTNVCSGGRVNLETLTPISYDQRFVGGVLRISSGRDAVTVNFNPDASAALTFADGSTATITAEEMESMGAACEEGIKGPPPGAPG